MTLARTADAPIACATPRRAGGAVLMLALSALLSAPRGAHPPHVTAVNRAPSKSQNHAQK
jgi:hypothetical protein